MIEVDAATVLAAGITPTRCAIWAMEKRRDGKPEQALRLLDACRALIFQESLGTRNLGRVLDA